jgi:hypothetical protein
VAIDTNNINNTESKIKRISIYLYRLMVFSGYSGFLHRHSGTLCDFHSILTFSMQNHLILTYFTHFDTTHFFYKYYNINKASNSPPYFSVTIYIMSDMKYHLPRFNSRFLRGKSLSRHNRCGRCLLVYCSV